MAAGRGSRRIGNFPLQNHALHGDVGIRLGYGGQKRPGIRMHGIGKQRFRFAKLYHPPQIHDQHPVGDMLHNAQRMRNKEIGQVVLLLQILQQIDDLRLDRYVQRRNRFITDDYLGLKNQRPGDADSLPLTA